MHNYHSTHGTFPLGPLVPPLGIAPGLPGLGDMECQALMLGYLEQMPLYNASNLPGRSALVTIYYLRQSPPVSSTFSSARPTAFRHSNQLAYRAR